MYRASNQESANVGDLDVSDIESSIRRSSECEWD
jgi:hypothetical protein